MSTDDLIRELCVRLVKAQGEEFTKAVVDLYDAVNVRVDVERESPESLESKGE